MTRQHRPLMPGHRPLTLAAAPRRQRTEKQVTVYDEFYPDGIRTTVTPKPGHTYTRETWPPRRRGRGESLTSPRRIEAKLKACRAWEMWQAGAKWQAIADTLGYRDRSGAWRAVRRAFDRYNRDRLLKGLPLIVSD